MWRPAFAGRNGLSRQTGVGRAMSQPSKVAERLLAHARLCRKFASASLDENIGAQLLDLAEKCVAEAAEVAALEQLQGNHVKNPS
jgi:hypothetical protein